MTRGEARAYMAELRGHFASIVGLLVTNPLDQERQEIACEGVGLIRAVDGFLARLDAEPVPPREAAD